MTQLFTGQSANGNSSNLTWSGGFGTFVVEGTWGSATAKLQMSPDNGTTWIDVGSDATLTADGMVNFQIAPCLLRVNLSGVTTTSLDAWVI